MPKDGANTMPTNIGLKNLLELIHVPMGTGGCVGDENVVHVDKPVCSQHGYKGCVFLCMECKVELCNYCITQLKEGTHYAHTIKEIDEAMS